MFVKLFLFLKKITKDSNNIPSKQQALDADPRAIQQINFTANLYRAANAAIFFLIKEAKETVLKVSQGTVKVL